MKKQYVNPSMKVVKIHQRGCILTGSIVNITGNTEIDYGGGGHVDPMAPKYDDDWDADDEW